MYRERGATHQAAVIIFGQGVLGQLSEGDRHVFIAGERRDGRPGHRLQLPVLEGASREHSEGPVARRPGLHRDRALQQQLRLHGPRHMHLVVYLLVWRLLVVCCVSGFCMYVLESKIGLLMFN